MPEPYYLPVISGITAISIITYWKNLLCKRPEFRLIKYAASCNNRQLYEESKHYLY